MRNTFQADICLSYSTRNKWHNVLVQHRLYFKMSYWLTFIHYIHFYYVLVVSIEAINIQFLIQTKKMLMLTIKQN